MPDLEVCGYGKRNRQLWKIFSDKRNRYGKKYENKIVAEHLTRAEKNI